jgi:hypothetical protein
MHVLSASLTPHILFMYSFLFVLLGKDKNYYEIDRRMLPLMKKRKKKKATRKNRRRKRKGLHEIELWTAS